MTAYIEHKVWLDAPRTDKDKATLYQLLNTGWEVVTTHAVVVDDSIVVIYILALDE